MFIYIFLRDTKINSWIKIALQLIIGNIFWFVPLGFCPRYFIFNLFCTMMWQKSLVKGYRNLTRWIIWKSITSWNLKLVTVCTGIGSIQKSPPSVLPVVLLLQQLTCLKVWKNLCPISADKCHWSIELFSFCVKGYMNSKELLHTHRNQSNCGRSRRMQLGKSQLRTSEPPKQALNIRHSGSIFFCIMPSGKQYCL